MARGKRTDTETRARVIEAKVNAPDLSSQDISDLTEWRVSKDTVCDILNDDLPQVATQSERIASLIDRNNSLQSSADAMISEMIAEKNKSITIAQLTSLRDSTFKQNQVIEMAKSGKEDSKTIVIQI